MEMKGRTIACHMKNVQLPRTFSSWVLASTPRYFLELVQERHQSCSRT